MEGKKDERKHHSMTVYAVREITNNLASESE
jgi:hypothetical protein